MRRVHRARGPQVPPAIGAVGGDPPRDSPRLVGLHRRSRRAAVRRDQVAAGRRRLRAHTRTLPAVSYTHPSMRLTSDEIEYISRKIVKTLSAEGKLEMDSNARVVEAIGRVITDELMVEDKLNEEVREVLIQHASEMERSNITYTEMFKMVKKKLAREKGIIL
ncbi:MAG: hypothetical protein DMF83_14875 [Acidobacteria bacterium]|nr:MAG: hypothetical protein DMF83_14875 [Acidobacteriota bacterium]